jgi:hypothetical protein
MVSMSASQHVSLLPFGSYPVSALRDGFPAEAVRQKGCCAPRSSEPRYLAD